MQNLIIFFIILIIIFSCSKVKEANLYVLEYRPQITGKSNLKTKFPYRIQVREFSISRTYDNSRIVVRESAHRIFYDRYSLWALRPQQSFANLMINHINALGIFESCQKRFLRKKADYMIDGTINKIEKYDSPEITRADLQYKIELYDLETDQVVLCRNFTSYKKLYTDNMSFFARTLSYQIRDSFQEFIDDMINYFNTKK